MKFANIVSLGAKMLEELSKHGGTIQDWKYLQMYQEFVTSREAGERYRSVIEKLSAKYKLSKTKIERIIRRFRKEL